MLTIQTSPTPAEVPLWERCLAEIEQRVGHERFETLFRATDLTYSPQGHPTVQVPNRFLADFIEEHYAALIADTLRRNSVDPAGLAFAPTERDWNVVAPIAECITQTREHRVPKKVESREQFHTSYTFERFVVGDSNRMAHAASMAVAEAPGQTSFNPLVIYGGTGLGKTHLLQAIGHFAQTEGTAENVLYMTSQEFISQYIGYVIDKHDSTSFYKKFADVELLLLDDIHFFSGKPGTQKEFYRIFNKLLLEKKQIVLSSDRPPEKIPDMMEHIINRFMGGLTTDIQPPNLETRMAIIRKKAETDGISLPPDVVQYIAGHITSSVRQIEGTLIKLIASASFTGKDITLEVAHEIFGDLISRQDRRLTTAMIQQQVADSFGVSANQLSAHTRRRDVTLPRSVAMYLCKKWTKQSLRTIGLDFGGRDYSTVIHACKKIEAALPEDGALREQVEQIETRLTPYV